MSSISEVDLAKEILLRAGFLSNRSILVSSVENELFGGFKYEVQQR